MCTMDRAQSEIKFYLDTSTKCNYDDIINHRKASFTSSETFNSLADKFVAIANGKKK